MIDLAWSTRHVTHRDNLAVVVIDMDETATREEFDSAVAEIRQARGWPSEREVAADEVEAKEAELCAVRSGAGWVEPAFRAGMLLASRLVRSGA
jgi:hypothetical protein